MHVVVPKPLHTFGRHALANLEGFNLDQASEAFISGRGMQIIQNRRRFIAGVSVFSATAIIGTGRALAEGPPETATARFADFPGGGCVAPQYVAEGLLRSEGFSDFRFVPVGDEGTAAALIAENQADFGLDFASAVVVAVDNGVPLKAL